MRGREIIKEVMEKRRVGPKDFFGTNRMPHVLRARAAAIKQMREAGMSQAAIGRIMKRSYSTIQYWVHPEYRQRHRAYCLTYQRQKAEMRTA